MRHHHCSPSLSDEALNGDYLCQYSQASLGRLIVDHPLRPLSETFAKRSRSLHPGIIVEIAFG